MATPAARTPSARRLPPSLALLAGLLVGGAAWAYVLPQGAVLRRMADARDELQLSTLRAEGGFTFSGQAAKEAAAALGVPADRPEVRADGVLQLRLPGRCRFDVAAPGSTGGVAVVSAGGRRRVEGREVPALAVALEQVCGLLAQRGSGSNDTRDAIERHIRALGVEPRLNSLGRFGGEVVYVLGDRAEGKAQLWVYKDAFRPARVRWTDRAGVAWDVRLTDYASAATGEWAPRSVEVWRGNERQLRFDALKGDNRVSLPDSLFGPAAPATPAP